MYLGLAAALAAWYNNHNVVIIPVHTGFCVHRRNPGAEFRRRLPWPGGAWYNEPCRAPCSHREL